jgi:hypothetical protein
MDAGLDKQTVDVVAVRRIELLTSVEERVQDVIYVFYLSHPSGERERLVRGRRSEVRPCIHPVPGDRLGSYHVTADRVSEVHCRQAVVPHSLGPEVTVGILHEVHHEAEAVRRTEIAHHRCAPW